MSYKVVTPKAQQRREPGHKQVYLETKQTLFFCPELQHSFMCLCEKPLGLSVRSFQLNFANMVSLQDLSLSNTRWWKTQEPGSAGTLPFRGIYRSPAQHYAGANHFQNPHFPACRLQYAHRGRKLIAGPNPKTILLPGSVSARHSRFPARGPGPGSTGTVTAPASLPSLAARADFTEDAPSVTVCCCRAWPR